MNDNIRWQQRFENFQKALSRLTEANTALQSSPNNQLYRIALIGSFMFSFELGWKVLKDYLEFQGISVSLPRDVIKVAFHHHIISDGQTWIDMLGNRNLMAHVYDEKKAMEASQCITDSYLVALKQLDTHFQVLRIL